MQNPEWRDLAIGAWRRASNALGIAVIAPFEIAEPGRTVSCVAFLPQFGSPKGTVVDYTAPPEFDTNKLLASWARQRGIFYTFLNVEKYGNFDRIAFQEALADWGFFGSAEAAPLWLPRESIHETH
jgi:hypothetical protein